MWFFSVSKCASLSSQRVSLALYVLFDLFLFLSGSRAWWFLNNSIGCPYIWSLKCSSAHTTARSSSSFIGFFFAVSDENPLAKPTGFKLPSLCRCHSVAPNLFVRASVVKIFSLSAFQCARQRIFVMYSFDMLNALVCSSVQFYSFCFFRNFLRMSVLADRFSICFERS